MQIQKPEDGINTKEPGTVGVQNIGLRILHRLPYRGVARKKYKQRNKDAEDEDLHVPVETIHLEPNLHGMWFAYKYKRTLHTSSSSDIRSMANTVKISIPTLKGIMHHLTHNNKLAYPPLRG